MPESEPKPKRGRPKGARGKLAASRTKAGAQLAFQGARAAERGPSPLEILLAVARDEMQEPEVRVRAAIGAAPYVHRKMPVDLNVGGSLPVAVTIVTPLTKPGA